MNNSKNKRFLDEQRTQGRKGMKMPRINMAFTPANIDYIRIMSALKGMTMTEYVNAVIGREREINSYNYDRAKEIAVKMRDDG